MFFTVDDSVVEFLETEFEFEISSISEFSFSDKELIEEESVPEDEPQTRIRAEWPFLRFSINSCGSFASLTTMQLAGIKLYLYRDCKQ